MDVIFEPWLRIGNLVDKGIGQRQAASRYLHDLADLGVLREMPFGKEKLIAQTDATAQPGRQCVSAVHRKRPPRSSPNEQALQRISRGKGRGANPRRQVQRG
ncbi:MAG: hypothetical protein U1E86_07580 [Burkholderiaceae bacterium]